MWKQFIETFTGNPFGGAAFSAKDGGTSAGSEAAARKAVAVLLAEAAALDGAFEAVEREAILRLVGDRFGVSVEEADRLLDSAREAQDHGAELYRFVRTIRESFDDDQRFELMEMLWEVVYADGVLHDHEAQLMRRLAGLLYVADRDSGVARKRALAKLGLADQGLSH
jgi:uncharacterized tellurite resistance protein B-like protein